MSTSNKIKIAFVEDNRFIRNAWEHLFKNHSSFLVTGSYHSCEEALNSPALSEAKIIVMDLRLRGISGAEGTRKILELYPEKQILICTAYIDDEGAVEAISAGGVGIIPKKTPPNEMIKTLRQVAEGGSPVPTSIAATILKEFAENNLTYHLTETEIKILKSLSSGNSYQATALVINNSVEELMKMLRTIINKYHRLEWSRSKLKTKSM